MDVRDGKCKGSPKKDGNGHYWNFAGMTLFVGENDSGETQYSVTLAWAPDHPVRFFPRQQRVQDSQHKQDSAPF